MSDLNDWANTAAANDRTQVPDYMPEGATPVPAFNDWGREVQAAVRRFFETLEWRNFLDDSESPTNVDGDTFSVPGGKETLFAVNQRVRITDATTFYATIVDITSNNITVETDGGEAISGSLTMVEAGLSPTGYPITTDAIIGLTDFINTVNQTDTTIANKIPLVDPATLDNAVVQNTDGTLVDAGVPLATIAYEETSAVAWNKQSTTTINHTLGVAPQFITPVLVCTVANNGYSIGDEFVTSLGCQAGDSGSANLANVALAIDVGGSSFKLVCYMRTSSSSGGFYLSPKAGGDSSSGDKFADPSEWDIKFRLFAMTGTVAAGT